jgi:hypothetical protein
MFVKSNKAFIKMIVLLTGLTLLSLVFIFGELKRDAIENEVANGRLNILNGTISKYKPYNDSVDLYIKDIKIKASFNGRSEIAPLN